MSGTRRSGLPSDGYFGMVAHWPKSPTNINTLWRSASLYDAAFVGTIGARYQRQPSDAIGTPNLVPLIDYTDIDDLITRLPHDCLLVAIELHECAKMLPEFSTQSARCTCSAPRTTACRPRSSIGATTWCGSPRGIGRRMSL